MRNLVVSALLVIALGLGVGFCSDDALDYLAREGVVIDTVAVYKERELKKEREGTDNVFKRFPQTIPTDTCKAAVKGERAKADSVMAAKDRRITNLRKQNDLLQPPRLKVFAEVDYTVASHVPILKGSLGAKAGVMLKIDKATYAYGARVQPVTGDGQAGWQVGVRREFRLF